MTHPDRLATLATLLGVETAPVERCRVLELGCASGGNLIPMAYSLPDSRFVGVDNAGRQIAEGRQVIDTLNLDNVQLHHGDIRDIVRDFGEFDYIIAHGVYSWVPADVREALFRICKQNLAPHGVAYVSYNVYPGWHLKKVIRDAMLFHTRDVTDPFERAQRARDVVELLAELAAKENKAYGQFLGSYAEYLESDLTQRTLGWGDAFLLHDELGAVNEPVCFYQFIEQAESHGLQYLIEATFAKVVERGATEEAQQRVARTAMDLIEGEQYMDFLENRVFRRTLLCHDTVDVRRTLTPAPVQHLYVRSRARAASDEPVVERKTVGRFRGKDGTTLSTDHPASKAAMLYLNEIWPRAVAFEGLLAVARARAGAGAIKLDQDASVLAGNLLQAFGYSTLISSNFIPGVPSSRQP